MSLTIRTRLGPYEILSALGAGGMGEVYRARDSKLNRDVALKVLPDSLANDPDRLARFQREAQVLASLNHPNIGGIYGLEESNGVQALVLELVEGPTLADRIAQAPIPLDEALPIAKQIAEALEAAHEHGIIHRDLKPANIKVRSDGTVKVLDFGLAKAMEPGVGSSPSVSQAPTITTPAMTGMGVILGTAAYMAPEQAKGHAADKRADVWAFGCVLYEMLTGTRAFAAADKTETLAAVLMRDPDWTKLPPAVPPAICTLLRRCLEKDRRKRIADVSTALFVLDESSSLAAAHDTSSASPPARFAWRRVATHAAAWLAGGAIVAAVGWTLVRPPSPRVIRTSVVTSGGTALNLSGIFRDVAITPDGSQIVYRGNNQLLVRQLGEIDPSVVTSGSFASPFLSPDGQWVGFFAPLGIRRIAITGGSSIEVTRFDGSAPRGATWGSDGTIIYATMNLATGLLRVPASGGEPIALTKPDPMTDHRWPQFLPDARGVLFTIVSTATPGTDNIQIAVLDLATGTHRVLVRGGVYPQYVPTGHVVYGLAGALRAVPFDLDRMEVTGPSVPVLEQVATTPAGATQLAFSDVGNGTMVHVGGQLSTAALARLLVWVNRRGQEELVSPQVRAYDRPRLSPDGGRIAVEVGPETWIHDIERGTLTRVAFEGSESTSPLWTPDGTRIAFRSNRDGPFSMYSQPADGSGGPERLLKTVGGANPVPRSWSADGRLLAYHETVPNSQQRDIWVLSIAEGTSKPFLSTPFNEGAPAFSPDGRWIAYTSNQSGRPEVYVQPYPGPGRRWQISTDGGREPVWSRNGQELFYRNDRQMLVVPVRREPAFSPGRPTVLFEGDYIASNPPQLGAAYDVSGDSARFLMVKDAKPAQVAESPTQINIVQNWFEELKRLVPTN